MRTAVLFLVLFFISLSAFPQEDDLSLIAEGKYFSVYGHRSLDVGILLNKIDLSGSVHIDSLFDRKEYTASSTAAEAIDALFREVSDILDIHIYSFHGTIKIFPDKSGFNAISKRYRGQKFSERSFYFLEKNTIYISFADMTLGMLGHEIAHAIISRYFVVPPPEKLQEVLSGYVEYTLGKKFK